MGIPKLVINIKFRKEKKMFERIANFLKKLMKTESSNTPSKETAKERLHLVLMQDRANVSADFLELMKQEIIEVIKKYIEVEESAIDVRLTKEVREDGTQGAPSLYANIPILNIKNDIKNSLKDEKASSSDSKDIDKEKEENSSDVKEENNTEKEEDKEKDINTDNKKEESDAEENQDIKDKEKEENIEDVEKDDKTENIKDENTTISQTEEVHTENEESKENKEEKDKNNEN